MYAIFKDELYEKAKEIYRQHLRFDAGDINNDQLYAHQNNRLREVIKYVADNSPFYREHLKGLTTTDIENSRSIIFTRCPLPLKRICAITALL